MLRVLFHKDVEAAPLLSKVSDYTKTAAMLKLPFWIFTEHSDPIGVVITGKEPVRLLAPMGTRLAIVNLIQKNWSGDLLKEFASQTVKLALEQEAAYMTVELLAEEEAAIDSFAEAGFSVLADSFMMSLQLNQEFTFLHTLEFNQVRKEEMANWIQSARKCLSGSKDVVMERILANIGDLPRNLMDMYYSLEKFYFVNRGEQEIGVLNYNPQAGMISNIGVDVTERGQGYGRQIMLFGLKQLQTANCEQAKLRVHVENQPAIRLYESLGFKVSKRRKLLIYETGT